MSALLKVLGVAVVIVQLVYWVVAFYCPVKVLLRVKTTYCTQTYIASDN